MVTRDLAAFSGLGVYHARRCLVQGVETGETGETRPQRPAI